MNNREDLLVKVEKIPLSTFMPGYKFPTKYTHAIVTYPPGEKKGRIVNFCSEDYTLVPNKDIMNRVEEGLNGAFDIDAKYIHKGYAKFYMDYTIKNNTRKVQKGDIVGVKVRIQNSYDGRLRFGYSHGLSRLVCTNGMTSLEQGKNVTTMHTPQIINKDMIATLIDETEARLKSLPELLKPYEKLIQTKFPMSEAEIIKRMETIAEDTNYPKRQIPDAATIALAEAKQLRVEMTDWLIYQGMNNILNHSTDFAMEWHKREQVDAEIVQKFLNP